MTTQNKKILIAEDEKPLSHALELKFQSAGFETSVAKNGEEALALMAEKTFDLVLMDLMMPRRDGFSTLEELKKKGDNTPVFVMSNLGQDEDIKKAKSLGAKEYIVKSNTPLAKIIEKVIAFLNHE